MLSPLMDKLFRHRNPFSSGNRSRRKSSSDPAKDFSSARGFGSGDSAVRGFGSGDSAIRMSEDRNPRRPPRDPLDPGFDLLETIAVNSSDDDELPIHKKKQFDDLESQRGMFDARGSASSGSTKVPSDIESGKSKRLSTSPPLDGFSTAPPAGLSPLPAQRFTTPPPPRMSSTSARGGAPPLPPDAILRTNEVIVSESPRNEELERLDTLIPWEMPTYYPPGRETNGWIPPKSPP